MTEPLSWLIAWLLLVGAGCALLLPLYRRFIRLLQLHHPDIYEAIGKPTLFMASPTRGLRLQRFIYSGATAAGMHAQVRRLGRCLQVLTPLFVIVVLGSFYYGYLSSIRALL